MTSTQDPFLRHPELRGKIIDPMTSFFRDFRIERVLEKYPEMEWARPLLHTAEKRDEIRLETLRNHPDEDLWIFAYGSLMWDPALRFSEVRRATVPGYERRFILRDMLGGRGTRESPGLMAALDHGAGCDGLMFRIPHDIIAEETEILCRRELVAPSYMPVFVSALAGGEQLDVLAFIADHAAEQICGEITRDEQIQYLVNGRGILGTSLEYLEKIVSQFDALGIVDAECTALLAAAHAFARAQETASEETQ